MVHRHPAFDPRHHLVLDADVGEGAAHHHFVVAAARAVLVEVDRLDLMVNQILAGGRLLFDRACRRDVVGGDRIEEQAEDATVDDVGDRRRIASHAGEIGRVLHVGGLAVPLVGGAALDRNLAPVGFALEHVGVFAGEHRPVDDLADHRGDLAARRPDVLEEHVLALGVGAERRLDDVDLERAGERIGDDERRRSEEVRAHVGVHAAFEIAVAREHRAGDEVVLVDGLGDFRRQRAGIADAGGAAEAHQVVADLVEVGLQPRLRQIFGDHLRAGRERSLHPRLGLEALGGGFAGEQPRRHHHARIGRVGARSNGGDHHVAVTEVVGAAGHRHAFADFRALAELFVERLDEGGLRLLEQHAVLRALRTRERRLDRTELELEQVGEDRVLRSLGAVETLRLGVGLDQRHGRGGTAGFIQIVDGVVVGREVAAGRAVFRRHVADGGAVLDREIIEAGPAELDEFVHDAALAQHLRDREHEVGGGDAFLELAGEPHADDLRQHHRHRLAEHGGFRLDAAYAPAEHGEAVDHGGVGIGSDHRVRIGDVDSDGLAIDLGVLRAGPHRLRQVFEVDLMADAGAGRHHAEIFKRALRPLEEAIAFLVLFVFLVDVLLESGIVAEEIDDHRVVDDEVNRHQRVDALGIAAEVVHGVAHGGEIDHRRNAGEVLHQHARRPERDLVLGTLRLEPRRDRPDVVLGDGAPVLEAQQVLEQHLHGERQARDAAQPVLLRGRQAVIGVGLGADLEGLAALEAVEGGHDRSFHRIGRGGASRLAIGAVASGRRPASIAMRIPGWEARRRRDDRQAFGNPLRTQGRAPGTAAQVLGL